MDGTHYLPPPTPLFQGWTPVCVDDIYEVAIYSAGADDTRKQTQFVDGGGMGCGISREV